MADVTEQQASAGLPDPDAAREWLETMMLIRRFEERAGEMYAKAKVGGFLHLAIGEEATIVGAVRAMRADDYLISTYRSHGHALARGSDPNRVMAELFGRDSGEVVLFWDTTPQQTGRLSRALKTDLAQLEAEEFLGRWQRYQTE